MNIEYGKGLIEYDEFLMQMMHLILKWIVIDLDGLLANWSYQSCTLQSRGFDYVPYWRARRK